MPSTIFSKPLNKQVAQNAADIAALSTSMGNANGAIAIVATGNTAPKAISAGQFVLWSGGLYTANSAIASGETLSLSNLTAVPDGGLNAIHSKFVRNIPSGTNVTTLEEGFYTASGPIMATLQNVPAEVNTSGGAFIVNRRPETNWIYIVLHSSTGRMFIGSSAISASTMYWEELALNSNLTNKTTPTAVTFTAREGVRIDSQDCYAIGKVLWISIAFTVTSERSAYGYLLQLPDNMYFASSITFVLFSQYFTMMTGNPTCVYADKGAITIRNPGYALPTGAYRIAAMVLLQ